MPRDGTANRERILAAAEQLVIDNGYSATSLDAVITASGTSKGAFFHHFESKLALAEELVRRYAAADIAHLEAAIEAVSGLDDPAERVVAFVRLFEDSADSLMSGQSSCLYVSVLTERSLVQTSTTGPIAEAVIAWRTSLAHLLREALPPDTEVDVEAVADHVFVTFEGAFILCRSMADAGYMKAQLRVLRQLIARLVGFRPSPAPPRPPGE